MFRLGRRPGIFPREHRAQTRRRHNLQAKVRNAFCDQASLQIVGLSSRRNDDKGRQLTFPGSWQNAFEPRQENAFPAAGERRADV